MKRTEQMQQSIADYEAKVQRMGEEVKQAEQAVEEAVAAVGEAVLNGGSGENLQGTAVALEVRLRSLRSGKELAERGLIEARAALVRAQAEERDERLRAIRKALDKEGTAYKQCLEEGRDIEKRIAGLMREAAGLCGNDIVNVERSPLREWSNLGERSFPCRKALVLLDDPGYPQVFRSAAQ